MHMEAYKRSSSIVVKVRGLYTFLSREKEERIKGLWEEQMGF